MKLPYYVKQEIEKAENEISIQESCIKKLKDFYFKHKNSINLQQNNFQLLKNFRECQLPYGKIKYDNYSYHEFISTNLSKFNPIDFCEKLTSKKLVKKTIYLNTIFCINDKIWIGYDDYDNYKLKKYYFEVLCPNDMKLNSTYSSKEIYNMFINKQIIILNYNTEISKESYEYLKEFCKYSNNNKTYKTILDIAIKNFIVNENTQIVFEDEDNTYRKFNNTTLPNLYSPDRDFISNVKTYNKIYQNFTQVTLTEILNMIPSEIKLRQEKIKKIKEDTIKFVKIEKERIIKELQKQVKQLDKSEKQLIEKYNNQEIDNLTF